MIGFRITLAATCALMAIPTGILGQRQVATWTEAFALGKTLRPTFTKPCKVLAGQSVLLDSSVPSSFTKLRGEVDLRMAANGDTATATVVSANCVYEDGRPVLMDLVLKRGANHLVISIDSLRPGQTLEYIRLKRRGVVVDGYWSGYGVEEDDASQTAIADSATAFIVRAGASLACLQLEAAIGLRSSPAQKSYSERALIWVEDMLYRKFSRRQIGSLLCGLPLPGASAFDVFLAIGSARTKTRTTTDTGISELWTYPGMTIVLLNGKVRSVTEITR